MMTNTETKKRIKLFKVELVKMLADHRMDTYPALYERANPKHYEDAKFFVVHHLGPTKADLERAARCVGLIPDNVEIY